MIKEKPKDTTRFSHTIPNELLDKVRDIAEKNERSVTWMINDLLKQSVSRGKRSK